MKTSFAISLALLAAAVVHADVELRATPSDNYYEGQYWESGMADVSGNTAKYGSFVWRQIANLDPPDINGNAAVTDIWSSWQITSIEEITASTAGNGPTASTNVVDTDITVLNEIRGGTSDTFDVTLNLAVSGPVTSFNPTLTISCQVDNDSSKDNLFQDWSFYSDDSFQGDQWGNWVSMNYMDCSMSFSEWQYQENASGEVGMIRVTVKMESEGFQVDSFFNSAQNECYYDICSGFPGEFECVCGNINRHYEDYDYYYGSDFVVGEDPENTQHQHRGFGFHIGDYNGGFGGGLVDHGSYEVNSVPVPMNTMGYAPNLFSTPSDDSQVFARCDETCSGDIDSVNEIYFPANAANTATSGQTTTNVNWNRILLAAVGDASSAAVSALMVAALAALAMLAM